MTSFTIKHYWKLLYNSGHPREVVEFYWKKLLHTSGIHILHPLDNYYYDPENVFYPNAYDYSNSNVTEKVLGPASEIYAKLVKEFDQLTISTTAGLERYHILTIQTLLSV